MQNSVVVEFCPSSTTDLIPFVGSFPAELDTGAARSRAPPVNPTGHSDEPEFASVIRAELDERRSHEVEDISVPQIHLDDPPSASEVSVAPMGFLCLIRRRHHRWEGVCGLHRLERIRQYVEGRVESLLAATVGFVVRVGGDETEQFVEFFGAGREDGTFDSSCAPGTRGVRTRRQGTSAPAT